MSHEQVVSEILISNTVEVRQERNVTETDPYRKTPRHICSQCGVANADIEDTASLLLPQEAGCSL